MDFKPISFKGFNNEDREKALSGIKRYEAEITPIMLYRTNNLIHSKRVLYHLEDAIPDIVSVYGSNFDIEFSRTEALVHDDGEIIGGDIPLHDKENMDAEDLEELAIKEMNAIPILVERYGNNVNDFNYAELLKAAKDKSRLEAQFVSFFDKFDAGGEAWHEVWAGNKYFLLPAGGHHGQSGGYVRRLNDFPNLYPNMEVFFEKFPWYLPKSFDFRSVAEKGKPHTEESLREDTGYEPYERWKKTIMKREGTFNLVNQVEFME